MLKLASEKLLRSYINLASSFPNQGPVAQLGPPAHFRRFRCRFHNLPFLFIPVPTVPIKTLPSEWILQASRAYSDAVSFDDLQATPFTRLVGFVLPVLLNWVATTQKGSVVFLSAICPPLCLGIRSSFGWFVKDDRYFHLSPIVWNYV